MVCSSDYEVLIRSRVDEVAINEGSVENLSLSILPVCVFCELPRRHKRRRQALAAFPPPVGQMLVSFGQFFQKDITGKATV